MLGVVIHNRWLALVIFVLSVGWLTVKQGEKSFNAPLSGDEAASTIASISVAQTGLPQMPSGQYYWRSPLSHYLNGLSIKILGNYELGWVAASLAAYALLLIVFSYFLFTRSNLIVALIGLTLLALSPDLQRISYSPRMYMVYTCFAALACLVVTFRQNLTWHKGGKLYSLLCVLAALAHQHFILFIPGLVLCGMLRQPWLVDKLPDVLRRWLRSPYLWAPVLGAIASVLIHFGEHHLPNAWANLSSQKIAVGHSRSFYYPLEVLTQALVIPAWIAILGVVAAGMLFKGANLIEGRWDQRHFVYSWTIFLPTYAAVSWCLPFQVFYYIAPLVPLFVLSILSFASLSLKLKKSQAVTGIIAACLFYGTVRLHQRWGSSSLEAGIVNLNALQANSYPHWQKMRRWVEDHNATIISSDPDIVYLKAGRADYEVREAGVSAATACSQVLSDQFAHPYIHSLCTMEQVEQEKIAGPILFIGSPGRLFKSMGEVVSEHLVKKYADLGVLDGLKVMCFHLSHKGNSCDELKKIVM